MDTAIFDQKISDKQIEVETLDSNFKSSDFYIKQQEGVSLFNAFDKANKEKIDLEHKKNQFIDIQNQIDTKTQEISTLEQQKTDLLNSLK